MAKKLYEESNISAIAVAIRAKNGLQDTYTVSEMAEAIEDIEPDLETLSVIQNGTYTPTAGKDGFSQVTVAVPSPQPVLVQKSIIENGTYLPIDDNADGYSQVTVDVPSSQPVLVQKNITANGTYLPIDDSADGYSQVTVSVTLTPANGLSF